MLYRALECCVMGRPDEPTTTAWITGHSREDARQRLQAALAATWGVEPSEIVWGGLMSEVELERNSCQGPNAGARRWLETATIAVPYSGDFLPTYDSFDHVLIFLPARDRRRLAMAWLEARIDAATRAVLAEEASSRCKAAGHARTAEDLLLSAHQMRVQAGSLTQPDASLGGEVVGATRLCMWLEEQKRDLAKAAEQFARAGKLRENGSPSARDYEIHGRELLTDVVRRHPIHTV
jgi:hypothetical protein